MTQTLPQGTLISDNDNQDLIDPEDATRLRATDWRAEGIEIDNEDHDGGASRPALKVGESGAVGESLALNFQENGISKFDGRALFSSQDHFFEKTPTSQRTCQNLRTIIEKTPTSQGICQKITIIEKTPTS